MGSLSYSPNAIVDDTFAEAFRSIYSRVLITGANRKWITHAAMAATGHASSTILCDCEAGVEFYVDGVSEGQITPDGRPGVYLQFHVPRFRKDRVEHLERVMIARLSQNVLTCPTTRCFDALPSELRMKVGKKIAYFGDRHQFRDTRFGLPGWVIPTLGGEFFLTRTFGIGDGLMGGNIWYFGASEQAAVEAAERGVEAIADRCGVIAPFPGGIAASGSKAGSTYSFLIASTYAEYCPTLRTKLGESSRLPEGVHSVMEIIINGVDLDAVRDATYEAIEASQDSPGLIRISAGNYGGRLGKSFIYLRPDKQLSSPPV